MKKKLINHLMMAFIIWPLFSWSQDSLQNEVNIARSNQVSGINNQDAVILEEDNFIHIEGQKAEFIVFTVTKKQKVKILSEAGVLAFSKYVMPESLDPTYIAHFPEARNYNNALDEMFMNYFKGYIIAEDGSRETAEITETTNLIEKVDVMTNYYGTYEQPCFSISNLKVGDIIEIEYSYYSRYPVNIMYLSSFRIFFHNDFHKNNYHLKLKHLEDLEINTDYLNTGDPDTTYMEDRSIVYEWFKRDLPACIHEAGSRPFKELPHVIFSVTPYELLYTYYFSFEERFIPFYALYAAIREQEHLSIAKSVHQGVTNSQYSQVNKFIRTQTEGITDDTLHYEKLKKIHHSIAEDFKFANDIDYFKKKDTRRPRFGDYTTKKTIRDISRYDIYACLIMKLDLPYFTAYICDNRVGELNNDYFSPMKDNDYMFAVVLENNTVQYVYPKQNRYGYYLNEFPFYYENSPARLVRLDDYRNYKDFISKKLIQTILPSSNADDNERRTNAMVHINIDSAIVDFKARINVAGQFSTMSRGLYLYDIKDPTVNELYNTKVWELNDQVTAKKPSVKVLTKEFPFTSRISATYSSKHLLSSKEDTLSLNLSHMFNHIVDQEVNAQDRHLNFYPDFMAQDVYVYYLKFDEDVKIINDFEDISIRNEYGELNISIAQLQANQVKISSSFVIKKPMVLAKDIDQVALLNSEIIKLNHSELRFILDK